MHAQRNVRKVIVQEFVSVDGFASTPDGSVDFVPGATQGDQGFGDRQMDFIDSIDTTLLGRVTYEMFASHWPNVTEGDDKPFADKLNQLHKVVFSRTLDSAPWGSFEAGRVVKDNAADHVVQMKRANGKDMVIWGSLSIAQSLASLVDEYQLIVCPVVLGGGKRVFHEKLELKLANTRSFDQGTVLLSYLS